MKKLLASLLAISALGATTLATDSAKACGGCFHPVTENTVVTGHRMAVSVSMTQAVLWDSIEYSGDPAEFSWVLPIKPGAFVEVASDAFFEVLEASTSTTVQQPDEGCVNPRDDDFNCGSTSLNGLSDEASFGTGGGLAPEDEVTVVHEGRVGPYETVTLSAENPNALAEWLEDNGYVLPDEVKPIIDAYVEEKFDFIALKLAPDQNVRAMTPVRVVTPGSGYTLPLRMVAAGVGESVDLVLYVIGEGRYQAAGYDNGTINPKLVSWDFKSDRSDYADLRLGLLEGNGGRTWLTSFAQKGAMNGIAQSYINQGFNNGEETELEQDQFQCQENIRSALNANLIGDAEASQMTCGELDDIGVALTGMHPRDVVVTRLEAKLPKDALSEDLRLEASDDQADIPNTFIAGLKINPCWDQQDSMGPIIHNKPQHRFPPGALILFSLGALGIGLAMRRQRATTTT